LHDSMIQTCHNTDSNEQLHLPVRQLPTWHLCLGVSVTRLYEVSICACLAVQRMTAISPSCVKLYCATRWNIFCFASDKLASLHSLPAIAFQQAKHTLMLLTLGVLPCKPSLHDVVQNIRTSYKAGRKTAHLFCCQQSAEKLRRQAADKSLCLEWLMCS